MHLEGEEGEKPSTSTTSSLAIFESFNLSRKRYSQRINGTREDLDHHFVQPNNTVASHAEARRFPPLGASFIPASMFSFSSKYAAFSSLITVPLHLFS